MTNIITKSMPTVIVGQGAIGLLCYHCLSQNSPTDISLLPSNNFLTQSRQYQTSKIRCRYDFTDLNQQKSQHILRVTGKRQLEQAQVIILCVKSYQVVQALTDIAGDIADDAIIILAHNGLGTVEQIRHMIKPTQVLLALLITHGVKKSFAYQVAHTGQGCSDLGLLLGQMSATGQRAIVNRLQRGLKPLQWQDSIQVAQWHKLAINCVINPLTALHNIDNGVILAERFTVIIAEILKEVVAVSSKEGLELNYPQLHEKVLNVAKNTAMNTSSMRADVLAGRKTEIDYINGYIHRLGEKHQLATPKNSALWLAISRLISD